MKKTHFSGNILFWLSLSLLMNSCVHDKDGDADDEAPEIYGNMPLEDALAAGIKHGVVLKDVKRLLKRRGELEKAGPLMFESMKTGILEYDDRTLLNATHLYLATPTPGLYELFHLLISSARPHANTIGWRIATIRSSAKMAAQIDYELTEALKAGEEARILIPEMANAVAANQMQDSYTLVRRGLMTVGGEEFVSAMAALDSHQASWDFMDYLGLSSAEELRQLTMVSVDLFSCVAIMRHLKRYPVDPSHGSFSHLFLYSVSRNRALAELAQEVLAAYVPAHTDHLAALLARLPDWVQISYLENARRNMTPKTGLVITALKSVSAKPAVLEEIRELNR